LLCQHASKDQIYGHQEDTNQTVRVWSNTAVVTALLWAKGTEEERRSTPNYGLATYTCTLLRAGATSLVKPPCRLKQRRNESRCCIVGGIDSKGMGEAMKRTGRVMRADR
jgi:hypothetical protein